MLFILNGAGEAIVVLTFASRAHKGLWPIPNQWIGPEQIKSELLQHLKYGLGIWLGPELAGWGELSCGSSRCVRAQLVGLGPKKLGRCEDASIGDLFAAKTSAASRLMSE